LSDETARKYMMLANGDATLEEIREKKAKSERERRAKAKASASVPKYIENSNHVVGKITQQKQQISSPSARVARIVDALSAADDDKLSQIEALLNITEENVNG
jgi:chromosome segregation ATPase